VASVGRTKKKAKKKGCEGATRRKPKSCRRCHLVPPVPPVRLDRAPPSSAGSIRALMAAQRTLKVEPAVNTTPPCGRPADAVPLPIVAGRTSSGRKERVRRSSPSARRSSVNNGQKPRVRPSGIFSESSFMAR